MSAPVEVLSRLLWTRDTAALPDKALADQLGLDAPALAALVQALQGEGEDAATTEHRIGFVPEDLPKGLKARQRTEKRMNRP